MPVSLQSPTEQTVARARWVLLGLFALLGILMSSWLSRLPSIRDALGLNEAELGLVLLIGAIGSLVTVAAAGPLVARFGGLVIMHTATGGFTGGLTLLTLGVALQSVPLLSAGIFLAGMSFALNNVPLNVEAAAVERHRGRTVIPQFHALFSVGALIGTLILGFVIMAASLSEGAANDWLAIAVIDGFGRPEAVGALVFGIFVASMASLAAPPLLGLVAHQIGARYALTLIIIVLLVSVSLAGHAEPTGTKPAAYRPVDSEDDDVKPVEATSDNLAGVVAAEVVSVLQDAPPQPERVPSP